MTVITPQGGGCKTGYHLVGRKCIKDIEVSSSEFYDGSKPLQIKIVSPYTEPALHQEYTNGETRKIVLKNIGLDNINPNLFTISDVGTQHGGSNVVLLDMAEAVTDNQACNNVSVLQPQEACNIYLKFSYLYDSVYKNVLYSGVNYPKYEGSINFNDSRISALAFSLLYERYTSQALADDSKSGKLYFFGSDENNNPDWDDYRGVMTNMDEGFFTQDQIVNEFNNVLEMRLFVRNEGQESEIVNPVFEGNSALSIIGHNCTSPLIANESEDYYTPEIGSYCYIDVRINFSQITDYSTPQYIQGTLSAGSSSYRTPLSFLLGINSSSGIIYRDRHFRQQNILDTLGNSIYPGDAPYVTRTSRTNSIFLPNERPSESICSTYNSATQTCTAYTAPSPNYQVEILTEKTYPNDIRVSVANGTNHSVSVLSNPIAIGSTTNIINYTFSGTCTSSSNLAMNASCTSNIGFTTTTKPRLFNIKLKYTNDPLDVGMNIFVKVDCDPATTHEEYVNGELTCVPSIRTCDVFVTGKVPSQCDSWLVHPVLSIIHYNHSLMSIRINLIQFICIRQHLWINVDVHI